MFRDAAYDRWEDAVSCYEKGNYLASTYLAGYSIECILKYVILKDCFPGQSQIILKDVANHNLKPLTTHNLSRLMDIGNGNNSRRLFVKPTKAEIIGIAWCALISQSKLKQCLQKLNVELYYVLIDMRGTLTLILSPDQSIPQSDIINQIDKIHTSK